MSGYLLAIDQGTTNTKALLIDTLARIVAVSDPQQNTPTHPREGWVEYDPRDLLSGVERAIASVLLKSGIPPSRILGVGMANQGETVIAFDTKSGDPVYPAISWQDGRYADFADGLGGRRCLISDATGLIPSSYFSAIKMRWILDNVVQAGDLAKAGRLCLATSDVWLLYHLVSGGPLVTDVSTASRTMLMNLKRRCWDEKMLELFQIPAHTLPKIVDNDTPIGRLDASVCGEEIPVGGLCVDQQAALFGHRCFMPGDAKITFGTGCFLIGSIGRNDRFRADGLLTSMGWVTEGEPTYVLDGGIHCCGALIDWLIDNLGLAESVAEVDSMLEEYGGQGKVFFIPALQGLAAPYWIAKATGSWLGLTADTNRKDLVCSAVEAITFRVREIVEAVANDGLEFRRVRVDGGLTNSESLMQLLANQLHRPVEVFSGTEATGYGAALFTGAAYSLWKADDIPSNPPAPQIYSPRSRALSNQRYRAWRKLLARQIEDNTHEPN